MVLTLDDTTQTQRTMATEEEEERVCYICLEPCDVLSHCACKHRYIHTTCLITLVESRNFDTTCSVCKAPLSNVRTSNVKTHAIPTWLCLWVIFCIVTTVVQTGLCAMAIAHIKDEIDENAFLAVGTAATAISGGLGLVYARKRAQVCRAAGMPVWVWRHVIKGRVSVVRVTTHSFGGVL